MAIPTAIIGAGLAGLVAARRLADAGRPVVILEAGHVPGGRLATRRSGRTAADSGAQFFTVRSERFGTFVQSLLADGLVFEWCRGFNELDGFPRYAVRGGMQALAARLAEGLEVRTDTVVAAVRRADGRPRVEFEREAEAGSAVGVGVGGGPEAGSADEGAAEARSGAGGGGGWSLAGADGRVLLTAGAVLLTPPVPVSARLLEAGGTMLDPALGSIAYHRVLALLVSLDRPSAVPPPGGHQSADGPFSFIGDNRQKGISEQAAVTFHLNHALSAQHWDDDDDEITATMLAWAEPWLGGAIPLDVAVVRWPWSGPVTPWPQPVADVADGVFLAGDAFGGPKVEGAYLSGWAAGERLLARP